MAPTLDLTQIADYGRRLFPSLNFDVGDSIFGLLRSCAGDDVLIRWAESFAIAKVRNPMRRGGDFQPLPGEIAYERRRLANPQSRASGILYDGYKLMALLRELIPTAEADLGHLHIVFTNQLFGTWDEGDGRYHARVSLYGFPTIISTTGIVEAPAKPREYYFLKQQYALLGIDDAAALNFGGRFQGRFLEYDDERLTEVMKGYLMQSVFYQLTGDPFCQDKNCRLYNAHWQEEVLRAQLGGQYEFCPFHQQQLLDWRSGGGPI
ncbi:MAG: hypothetical protein HY664_03040 [Chloroflexi bacterium]|nr:hypothetical protein [Chloroflexota bacterium]